MGKIYLLFLSILIVACNRPEQPDMHKNLWTFEATNNDPKLDALCTPIINEYEGILKGLAKNDTTDVFLKARAFIVKCDTLFNSYSTTDSIMFNLFKNGLVNLQDELQGLVLEQYPEELNMAMNMVSIQLLHLLGSVGYTKLGVYIFNTNGRKANLEEDGLLWISFNKKSINPYFNTENELVNANYILQEN